MENILFLCQEESDRSKYLADILKNHFYLERVDNISRAVNILNRRAHDIYALIIDNPSKVLRIKTLLKEINKINTDFLVIPVLLLSDEENRINDEVYLGNNVIAFIEKGQSEKVVVQRINKSVDILNSLSFKDFAKMLEALPSLFYLKDAKGRYVFSSHYWNHLKVDKKDKNWTIRGKTDLEIRVDKENAIRAYQSDLEILKNGKGVSYMIEEKNDDGTIEFFEVIKEIVKDKKNKTKGIIAIVNNVTAQELLRRKLKRQSITDELTELYNRFYYDEFLDSLTTNDYPISIISADCDGLKTINDKYGHNTGDEYLRKTACLLKEYLPEDTLIFRMGGDEFLAVLTKTEQVIAEKYLEKLKVKEKDYDISVSFGTCTIQNASDPFDEYLAKSDLDMYRNKRLKKSKKNQ